MSIPKTPCPIKGLVPWANGLWPVVWRGEHPVLGWLYTIHEKQPGVGLCIHWNVSQQQIVKAMEAVAIYKPGQLVQLAPLVRRRVLARKWSFQRGTFFYLIEGGQPGKRWSVEQEELVRREKAVAEEHA